MQYGLTEDGLSEFCNKIKEEARKTCGLSDNELTLDATKVGDKISLAFNLKNRKGLDCVKKAIEKIIPSMPITTKPLFENLIIQIDKKEC